MEPFEVFEDELMDLISKHQEAGLSQDDIISVLELRLMSERDAKADAG